MFKNRVTKLSCAKKFFSKFVQYELQIELKIHSFFIKTGKFEVQAGCS